MEHSILQDNSNILFNPGRVVATQGVIALCDESDLDVWHFLMRHLAGDWGELCDDDIEANKTALENGYRLLSVYDIGNDKKIWIITEADRSATTVLLPSEY